MNLHSGSLGHLSQGMGMPYSLQCTSVGSTGGIRLARPQQNQAGTDGRGRPCATPPSVPRSPSPVLSSPPTSTCSLIFLITTVPDHVPTVSLSPPGGRGSRGLPGPHLQAWVTGRKTARTHSATPTPARPLCPWLHPKASASSSTSVLRYPHPTPAPCPRLSSGPAFLPSPHASSWPLLFPDPCPLHPPWTPVHHPPPHIHPRLFLPGRSV